MKNRIASRPRKPLAAVQVEARWLQRPAEDCPGLLSIETEQGVGQCYAVATIKDDAGATLGYSLLKSNGETYSIPADLSSCECKDWLYRGQYRPGGCKHVQGLKAGLALLTLPAADDAAADDAAWEEAETRWQPTAAALRASAFRLASEVPCIDFADQPSGCEQWPGYGEDDAEVRPLPPRPNPRIAAESI